MCSAVTASLLDLTHKGNEPMSTTAEEEMLYKPLKWIAIVNILVALDTLAFWIGFFTELTFPKEELSKLIPNFDGYYAWESCFVVPDSILAFMTIFASVLLLKNQQVVLGKFLLGACAGAWIFLGVLDFTYGITNGMYTLGHPFSYTLLTIGLGLPVIGTVTLWVLFKSQGEIVKAMKH